MISAPTSTAEFMTHYSVPSDYTKAINDLRGRNIVFIGDNSGSMERPLMEGGTQTRWEKLLHYARMICDIAPLLDRADGFDLCFLNPLKLGKYLGQYLITGIKSQGDIQEAFSGGPGGGTPLIARINEILAKYTDTLTEKDLVLYVATDGLNTNEHGKEIPGAMRDWVTNTFAKDQLLREHVHINFMLLSDEEKVISEYDGVDRLKGAQGEHLYIDVTSPSHIEKKQFEKANPGKIYTEGTEIGKMLTGASNKMMDGSDEIRVVFTADGNVNTTPPQPQGCCIIS